MTTALAERRKKSALRWAVAALATLAVAAIVVTISARSADPTRVIGPVVPGLAQSLADAQKITIISSDARYRIANTARGWALTDRGDFPVRAQRLAQLTQGLSDLAFVRRMTADPDRHEQLGVADPTQGGNGVLVQIENSNGAFLVDLIIGTQRNGLFVRRPNENQVWAVRGELPPLRDPSTWLDLQPLSISPDSIVRAEVAPQTGAPYILQRNAETGAFAFAGAQASREPLSASALRSVAERLAQVQPVDVLPASGAQGPVAARLRVILANGVAIDAQIVTFENRPWLKLSAAAPSGANAEAQAAAAEVNERARVWAYALSSTDMERLAPPLDSLVATAP
ncbi:MAG: DUF4340 domain-containing protein [Hydrogenophilaceae bacterium]|jgi:hypothetical protein|nr:DUF4340 domain-containing protein [Hydrogenophilaceae bacterium]